MIDLWSFPLFVTDWSSLVVGKVSPWIQPDSSIAAVRSSSEKVELMTSFTSYMALCFVLCQALLEELTFSSHLNVPAVLISLSSSNCANLSRCLMTHLNKHTNSVVGMGRPFGVLVLNSVCIVLGFCANG